MTMLKNKIHKNKLPENVSKDFIYIYELATLDRFIMAIFLDRVDLNVDDDWEFCLEQLKRYEEIYPKLSNVKYENLDRSHLKTVLEENYYND